MPGLGFNFVFVIGETLTIAGTRQAESQTREAEEESDLQAEPGGTVSAVLAGAFGLHKGSGVEGLGFGLRLGIRSVRFGFRSYRFYTR